MKISRYRIETIDFFEFQFVLAPQLSLSASALGRRDPGLEQSREYA
jgi:hypothetical protein